MNGKGMAPRKGYNQKLYAENYDRIFRKKKTNENRNQKTKRASRSPQGIEAHIVYDFSTEGDC